MKAEESTRSFLGRLLSKVSIRAALFVKKSRLKSNRDFDFLFGVAGNDFGILQKKSEIKSLCDLVAGSNPSLVCEIGSYKGGTSFLFVKSFDTAEKIIFVDKAIFNDNLLHYYTDGKPDLFFIEADSCSPVVVGKINNIIDDKPLDFLFIDGDHNFAGVKNDLLTYYDLVKDGGYIAFHDIMPDHRTLYNQKSGSWSGEVYKVWQCVKDLFESVEFVETEGQDGFGIGVVRKDSAIDLARVEAALRE